jgi:NTE family protein
LWESVSRAALLSSFRRTPLDVMLGRWTIDTSPMFIAFDLAARIFSPYDLNPRGSNPLREIQAQHIDFKRIAGAPITFRDGEECAHRTRPGVSQCRANA